MRKRGHPDGKGRAEDVGVECVVRPLKMAALLLSVPPLLDQALLLLHAVT